MPLLNFEFFSNNETIQIKKVKVGRIPVNREVCIRQLTKTPTGEKLKEVIDSKNEIQVETL